MQRLYLDIHQQYTSLRGKSYGLRLSFVSRLPLFLIITGSQSGLRSLHAWKLLQRSHARHISLSGVQ
jgi:hypothetical protein